MGMPPPISRSSFDRPPSVPSNPNPRRFKIWRTENIAPFLVIEVAYLDCTNYEGRKVLVFENVRLQQLLEQGAIDPHFSDNPDRLSPVARFEPTERGWKWAVNFAERWGGGLVTNESDIERLEHAVVEAAILWLTTSEPCNCPSTQIEMDLEVAIDNLLQARHVDDTPERV